MGEDMKGKKMGEITLGVELGADLIASDTTSCNGDSSSGDRE